MIDVIIRNGFVIDGTGKPGYVADIAIKGEKIVSITPRLGEIVAKQEIDARGMIVSPGFVDLHTHSDFTLLVNGKAESQVHQGVTFEAVGNCGHGCAPVIGDPILLKRSIIGHSDHVEISWRTFAEYLNFLERLPLGVNVAAYVGHGPLRIGVLSGEQRPAKPEEIKSMAKLLAQCLDEGAIGFSTGLEYAPGNSARTEELLALCETTNRANRVYATHVRNRDYFYEQGIGEALGLARISGVPTQLSHITPKFGAPAHATERALEMINWTKSAGVDVAFDVIPHEWGPTLLSAVLPSWAFEGGLPALQERLRNREMREMMKNNPMTIWKLVPAKRWDQLILFASTANPQYIGMTFEQIGDARQQDPHDAIFDILLEENEDIYSATWIGHTVAGDDLKMTMQESDCAVMSDSITLAPYGDLSDKKFSPSSYGWVARWLGHYARDERVVSIEEAIRRITSLPAKRLAIKRRGTLAENNFADITVFDINSIEDQSTISEPNVYPKGIKYVLVNGQVAIDNGVRTEINAGRVIRADG